jgi:hypothetical protein
MSFINSPVYFPCLWNLLYLAYWFFHFPHLVPRLLWPLHPRLWGSQAKIPLVFSHQLARVAHLRVKHLAIRFSSHVTLDHYPHLLFSDNQGGNYVSLLHGSLISQCVGTIESTVPCKGSNNTPAYTIIK